MSTYHLHKWALMTPNDPFMAPEIAGKRLVGCRDDDPRQVITSPIVKIDGRNITTLSGSVYILEDPDPDYWQWMADNGYLYDPENPIKDKSKS